MGLRSVELINRHSCFNKAKDDEPMFILLGSDPAAAATIRFWCDERQKLGIDWPDSEKQIEARMAAGQLQRYYETISKQPAAATLSQPAAREPEGQLLKVIVAIEALHSREERIGGQRAKYLNRETVLDTIKGMLRASSPTEGGA